MALRKVCSLSVVFFALIALAVQSLAWADQILNVKSSAGVESLGILYTQLSLSSWQETFQLTSPGQEVELISTPIGFCPGAGYRQASSRLVLGREWMFVGDRVI